MNGVRQYHGYWMNAVFYELMPQLIFIGHLVHGVHAYCEPISSYKAADVINVIVLQIMFNERHPQI